MADLQEREGTPVETMIKLLLTVMQIAENRLLAKETLRKEEKLKARNPDSCTIP